jgi:cholesterol transport system auxiliary component
LNPPAAALPPVRVGAVRAVAPFQDTDMHYRLAWRNPAEIAPFASSRWAATPAELVRKQLLRAAVDGGKCRLDVELQEFTQVFASAQASEARVELRASLAHASGNSSRALVIVEPNAGADAASGAAALARAVERAVGELGGWVAGQPACR